MAVEKSSRKGGESDRKVQLNLVGLKPGEDSPSVIIVALDRAKKPLYTAKVGTDNSFDLPSSILKSAYRIVIAPETDNLDEVDPQNLLVYRPTDFATLLNAGIVNVARNYWDRWFLWTTCVTGSVRHCVPYPYWWQRLQQRFTEHITALPNVATRLIAQSAQSTRQKTPMLSLTQSAFAIDHTDALIPFPLYRCETVCIGTVEVYRRTCCCTPIIIDDPRIPEIILDLDDIVQKIPDIPFPPNPPDPPDPWLRMPEFTSTFLKGGTLNEKVLNARQDLEALRSLPKAEAAAYIQARPYLWICTCGASHKVGEGFINPDGTFQICWREFPYLTLVNCHAEYAYVVKQTINGSVVTIYNGLLAGQWFDGNDHPTLTSYNPDAIGCPDPNQGVGDAAVYLDTIGGTESWHLATPLPVAWDSVGAPAYNSGLAFPAATDAAAAGQYLNCNWGGTLYLRYMFTWQLKALGAKYYRISWIEADPSGAPLAGATRQYFSNGLAWKKYENLESVPVTLGPIPTLAGENNLYEIPYYDGTVNWTGAVTYHGYIQTNAFTEGRYLVSVEIFDSTGKRLKPLGTTSIEGDDVAKGFRFLRWVQDTDAPNDDFVNVPFAALTHMFWWDNRPVQAVIESVYLNNMNFSEECLFLTGQLGSTVAIGYRAFHPNPRFHKSHGLGWRRGIGIPTPASSGGFANATPDALGVPVVVHGNVGTTPIFPPGVSGTQTFQQMLRPELVMPPRNKCTFTVTLSAQAKTFDGSWHPNPVVDYGSFALEIG